jgi:hypothetical protein
VSRNESWDELVAELEHPLEDAIADAVIRAAGEEIALLALVYDDHRVAPPGVAFMTTRERDEALAGDDSDGWILASPADWENCLIEVPFDSGTDVKRRRLEALYLADESLLDAHRDLALVLAERLTKRKWPDELARSDDFAVYAIDLDAAADLERNVPLTMTAAQRATYRL